jgi:hypothetical protein
MLKPLPYAKTVLIAIHAERSISDAHCQWLVNQLAEG